MFFKFLYTIALVAAALVQTSIADNVFPDFEEDETTRRNLPSLVIPGFEDKGEFGKVNHGNLVIPNFEDENETQIPSDNGNSPGEGSISGSITSFPVTLETTRSNGFQEITEEVVAENTEDLSGQTTTSSSVTETLTKRPGLQGLFDIFGNAAQEVVKENADRFSEGVNAILGAGQSILHATNNMRDAKMTMAASIPRGWHKVFEALNKQE